MLIETNTLIDEFLSINKEIFSKSEILEILKDNSNKLVTIVIDDITINPEKHLVTINEVDYTLQKKEFQLLYMFMSNKNKTLSRTKILETVWGTVWVDERTIDVAVSKLRRKLKIDNIKTLKGFGYQFK